MRKWGRAATLIAATLLAIVALPLYFGMISQVRVDSEVGVMMYGMTLLMVLLAALPIVLLCSGIWAAGLVRDKAAGVVIPLWESFVVAIILIITGIAMLLHWEPYTHLLRHAVA